jgi:F-type H+-transporting ATPase subunit gamma
MLALALSECIYADSIPQEHWLNKKTGKTLILVLSTNQGFCGPFPQLITKRANNLIEQNPGAYVEVFGKKGSAIKQNPAEALFNFISKSVERPKLETDIRLFTEGIGGLIEDYIRLHGVWDIYVVSGEYKNAITQRAKVTQLFPIEIGAWQRPSQISIDGDRTQFLEEIFREYIGRALVTLTTEHLIAEFSARVITMDNSVKNAKDMSENLGILYNRMRQDKITQELSEIVSSTECI